MRLIADILWGIADNRKGIDRAPEPRPRRQNLGRDLAAARDASVRYPMGVRHRLHQIAFFIWRLPSTFTLVVWPEMTGCFLPRAAVERGVGLVNCGQSIISVM